MDLADGQVVLPAGLAQDAVGAQEGVVRAEGHLAPADEVHDEQAVALAVIDAKAAPGLLGGIVGRAQDVGAVVEVGHDLPLVIDVVAERDDVGARGKDLVGLVGRDADARGVLAVYDGEVGRVLLLDRAQQAAQGGKAGLGDDVADR